MPKKKKTGFLAQKKNKKKNNLSALFSLQLPTGQMLSLARKSIE